MSRKVHNTGRKANKQVDLSGLRGSADYKEVGNAGLDNGQMISIPNKYRAFGSTEGKYPLTKRPTRPSEEVANGAEGPVRGRQADKGDK